MQALGLIETKGLIAAIESADAMLKAADVNLLEKTYVGGGLVSIIVTGDVGAVKAAVEAGGAAVRKINRTLLVSEHVIPRPHEDLEHIMIPIALLKNVEISTEVSEKTVTHLQMNSSEIPNKEEIDKMILEYGLGQTIDVLSKYKVIVLRNLARGYKNFGIAGRTVSKANKGLLLTKFKEYYGNN